MASGPINVFSEPAHDDDANSNRGSDLAASRAALSPAAAAAAASLAYLTRIALCSFIIWAQIIIRK